MLEVKPTQPRMVTTGDEVSHDVSIPFDIKTLPFRDPSTFVAGNLHNHLPQWQHIIGDNDWNSEVLDWIKHDITKYFTKFSGRFRGRSYVGVEPPCAYFPNAQCCCNYTAFINKELTELLWFDHGRKQTTAV